MMPVKRIDYQVTVHRNGDLLFDIAVPVKPFGCGGGSYSRHAVNGAYRLANKRWSKNDSVNVVRI